MTPARIDERVKVNDTTLRARIEGKPGAPLVALVHSLGSNSDLWDGQVAALAANYHVLRFDMRGHGKSDSPPGPYTMDALVDDLLGLLAHFDVERAHLVGISLGALVSLAAAIRGPREVASIAICDSRADPPPEFNKATDERNALIREKGMSAIDAQSAERWLTAATLTSNPAVARKVRDMVLAATVEGFAAATHAIRSQTIMEGLGRIRVPSLFVAADQDGPLPLEVIRAMQQKVPDSRFAVIPAASHLSNLDQPEIFNAILVQHLKRVA